MSENKYEGPDLTLARQRAGHSLVKASVAIETSQNTLINFECREQLPKSKHLQKAIFAYIRRYCPDK